MLRNYVNTKMLSSIYAKLTSLGDEGAVTIK